MAQKKQKLSVHHTAWGSYWNGGVRRCSVGAISNKNGICIGMNPHNGMYCCLVKAYAWLSPKPLLFPVVASTRVWQGQSVFASCSPVALHVNACSSTAQGQLTTAYASWSSLHGFWNTPVAIIGSWTLSWVIKPFGYGCVRMPQKSCFIGGVWLSLGFAHRGILCC